MIAFACNPAGSGEHWLGWGWAEAAAKSHDVTLLTWDRFGQAIQRHASACGIKPVYVGVRGIVNRVGDSSGAGRWLRQVIWHRRAGRIAAALQAQQPFDLVHQTTFHTFRIPFRAASWGIPAVWGPIAGGESVPPGFADWLGRLRIAEAARRAMNQLALAQPGVQMSLRRARVIFVSNQTTLNFLPAWCRERCIIVPPNAVRGQPPSHSLQERPSGEPLKLLFVGNCVGTRSIPLVFEALRRVQKLPWRFTIVGSGSSLAEWQSLAEKLSFTDKVIFAGQVPRAELDKYYSESSVFVFPALRDSGGSGLLEAMSHGLAVVCCNWAGPAEVVNETSGVRVSVRDPETTIQEFAAAFERLHADPAWRIELGRNAIRRAMEVFSWDRKQAMLEAAYASCLAASR